jgi:hypothetical protein
LLREIAPGRFVACHFPLVAIPTPCAASAATAKKADRTHAAQ